MDNKEVLDMKPGRELDILVAHLVMGKKYPGFVDLVPSEKPLKYKPRIPRYSTNVNSAEKVLDKIRNKYPIILQGADFWDCQVFLPIGTAVSSELNDSLSLAVCKAALLTVLEEESPTKIEDSSKKNNIKVDKNVGQGII